MDTVPETDSWSMDCRALEGLFALVTTHNKHRLLPLLSWLVIALNARSHRKYFAWYLDRLQTFFTTEFMINMSVLLIIISYLFPQ